MRLRTLHLFAGGGGGLLADLLLGHQPVCAVEIDGYCQQVLAARQKDGDLPWFPIFDDVTEFNGKMWRGLVDVIAGGFPCQDISAAGKGAGITGERSGLWSEFARIIGEVRPRYVFVENSPILTSRGLGVVLGDLAALGLDARWGVLGAAAVGAPHRRERIWIVANAKHYGFNESSQRGSAYLRHAEGRVQKPERLDCPSKIIPNTNDKRRIQGMQRSERKTGRSADRRDPPTADMANSKCDRLERTEPADRSPSSLRRRSAEPGGEVSNTQSERREKGGKLRPEQSAQRVAGSCEEGVVAHTNIIPRHQRRSDNAQKRAGRRDSDRGGE